MEIEKLKDMLRNAAPRRWQELGVGAKIKAILKEQKKTIKQLAEESGVPLNTLYSITKRDSTAVTNPVLEKVSKALGVTIESLLPDGGPVGIQMCQEAADALEQLQAENDRLKETISFYCDMCIEQDGVLWCQSCDKKCDYCLSTKEK